LSYSINTNKTKKKEKEKEVEKKIENQRKQLGEMWMIKQQTRQPNP
jgi:hypothetical protein